MELGGPIWGLCHETTCPSCQDYFKDPVTTDCGHNFCQVCISRYCGESGRLAYCPQCREIIRPWNCKPNWKLANIVEITKKLQEQKLAEGKWGLCEKHLDPLKLYCKDDEAPICVVCDRSKEHRDHNVFPIEEISQEYKEKIKEYLESLKNEKEKLEDVKLSREQRVQECLTELEMEKQKILSAFEGIQIFFDVKKHFWLNQLENLEMEIKKREVEKLTRLSEESSQLTQVIAEMEGTCQTPTSEFVQNIRNVLRRHKKNSEGSVVDHFPTLEKRLRIYSHKITDLRKAVKDSQDSLEQALNIIDLEETIDTELAEQEVPGESEVIAVPTLTVIQEPAPEMPVTMPSLPMIEQPKERKETANSEKGKKNLDKHKTKYTLVNQVQEFQKNEESLEHILNVTNLNKTLKTGSLERALKQTLQTGRLKQVLNKVRVGLDPDTAHPQLSLSEDLKRLTAATKKRNVPNNPERFNPALCVMGNERITSGRHGWEVEVQNRESWMSLVGEPEWVIGVARDSLKRKGDISFNPSEGVWAVGKPFSHIHSSCQVWAFTYPDWTPVTMRQETRKIRVAVDYEMGHVEFFDADTDDTIFAFPSASFSGEGIRPFFHTGMWGVSLQC